MDAFETIKKTIREQNLLRDHDTVIIGFSGGPDSICLLHCLHRLAEYKLYAVHVNHQLRGDAADADEAFAQKFCEELGIPCAVYHFDVTGLARQQGISTEDAGRRVRYRAFSEVREQIEAARDRPGHTCIAVAQNANDQAETVLMRMMRGTGLTGLGAMDYSREDGVVRPLLDVSREKIEEYCIEQGLQPRIDHTNLETDYTRNRIRLELLPYMKKHFNENIIETLNRLASIAREDSSFIDDESDRQINKGVAYWKDGEGRGVATGGAEIRFPLELLQKQPPSLRHRMIFKLFGRLGLEKNIGAVHLEQADAILAGGKTSASVDFPQGYRLRIAYGEAVFLRPGSGGGKTPQFRLEKKIVTADEAGSPGARGPDSRIFDSAAVKATEMEPVLRTRRPADYIQPLGMKGTKKLQDFFIDKKVPRDMRDRTLLVCLGSEVIWVVGMPEEPNVCTSGPEEAGRGSTGERNRAFGTVSEVYKVCPETEEVLLLRILQAR